MNTRTDGWKDKATRERRATEKTDRRTKQLTK